MVNAAKHAGAGRVDVYAEVDDGAVDVFVRDRGAGFDPDDGRPRTGTACAESIIGRMERHGGTRRGPQRARRGHRGRAGDAADRLRRAGDARRARRASSTTTRCSAPASAPSSATGPVEVVGEADDVDRRSPLIADAEPDVVLLDVHLPGGGGVEVHAPGRGRERPDTRFLALSVSDAAEDVIGVIRAGARGYVTKTITGPELADAIAPGRRRRRGVLAAAGRLRARRVRGLDRASPRSTRTSTGSPRASARCCG